MVMEIALGKVVYSKAGRDKGRSFIVTGIIDDIYVLISDGTLRKIDKPKRKKIKHLAVTNKCFENLGIKLQTNERVSNSDLRKALESLESENGNENIFK